MAALEKWICTQIENKNDVAPIIDILWERSNSLAIIGVLINIGKYKPELLLDVLCPLAEIYELYLLDDDRVKSLDYAFDRV